MALRPVTSFLLLAYGISWGIFALGKWGLGVSGPLGWTAVSALFMFGPAMAALAMRRKNRLPWPDLGVVKQGIRWKWMGLAVVIAMALPPLTLFFNWLLGDIFGLAGFGHTSISKDMATSVITEKLSESGADHGRIDHVMEQLAALPLNGPLILVVLLLFGALAGCTVNFLFAMGEELGWRGMLFHSTRPWGLWKQVGFTGLFWGLWHAPLIMEGHNYPDHPMAGVAFMCLLTTALALPLTWVRFRSRCVWSAGLLHGTVNGVAGAGMLFNTGASSLAGGTTGASAVLALILIGALLMIFDTSFRAEFNRA